MKKNLAILSTAFVALSAISFGVKDLKDSYNRIQKVLADEAIENYYSSVNTTTDEGLFTKLRSVISANYHSIGYKNLYTAYAKTDVREDGYIRDLYSNMTNYPTNSRQCGSYHDIGDCYNREHTIPQSWWGGGESNQGCDIYIVYPSDGKINGTRSNWPFGETSTGKTYSLTGDPSGNRLGTSDDSSIVSGTVFEPFDDRKGDMARTYFYAATRWSNSSGWTGGAGGSVFGSGSNTLFNFKQSYLNLLLKWHALDPVDEYEINRTNEAQKLQGNRNPFIDHPSYVDLIWGGEYPSSGLNYEFTNGGAATVVNGHIVPGEAVDPTGITLSKTSIDIKEEGTYTLSATIAPSNTTYKSVVWSSDNEGVATVNASGVVTGVSIGTAVITAKVAGYTPEIKTTCTVTVTAKDDPTPPTPDPGGGDEPTPEPPSPTPSGGGQTMKGCNGNIFTVSLLISTLSLTGIIILLVRKKRRIKE